MKTIRTLSGRIEAEILKGILDGHGIPAQVLCDDEGGIAPGMAPTKTAQGVILFIGVYINTYETNARRPSKAEYKLII